MAKSSATIDSFIVECAVAAAAHPDNVTNQLAHLRCARLVGVGKRGVLSSAPGDLIKLYARRHGATFFAPGCDGPQVAGYFLAHELATGRFCVSFMEDGVLREVTAAAIEIIADGDDTMVTVEPAGDGLRMVASRLCAAPSTVDFMELMRMHEKYPYDNFSGYTYKRYSCWRSALRRGLDRRQAEIAHALLAQAWSEAADAVVANCVSGEIPSVRIDEFNPESVADAMYAVAQPTLSQCAEAVKGPDDWARRVACRLLFHVTGTIVSGCIKTQRHGGSGVSASAEAAVTGPSSGPDQSYAGAKPDSSGAGSQRAATDADSVKTESSN